MHEKSVIRTDMLCPKIPNIRTVFGFNLKNGPQNGEETIDVYLYCFLNTLCPFHQSKQL